MKRFVLLILLLVTMVLSPVAVHAISGHFNDPGGGTYWCNVYVAYVSSGKS